MSGKSNHVGCRAEILERVRSEYLEMPGLRLTSEQVQRLCGVDRTICQDVLTTLVEMKFLSRKPNGAYARVTDGAEIPGSRAAKTALRAESTIQLSQGIAADTRRSAMTGDRPDRVERRRGRSAEELRKQRDEMKRQWEQE